MKRPGALLLASIAFLVGCEQDPPQEVSVGTTRLGVAFGDNLDELRSSRRLAKYAPYAGWMEELKDDSTFQQAIYVVGSAPPAERPIESGELQAVQLLGRSAAMNASILRELDQAAGPRQYRGCTPVPGRGAREEIAVLTWGRDGQRIVAEVLMTSTDADQMREPLSLTIVPTGTQLEDLGIGDLSDNCFSKSVLSIKP